MAIKYRLHLFVVIFVPSLLAGQSPELARMQASQRQTTEALVRAARDITAAAASEIASRESWEPLQEKRREEMRDMLGLLPWPERTPLNLRITGTIDQGSYTIEKIAFESLPKIYATANLYVPKQRAGKVPAVIYVCGHSYSPHGAKAKYQRYGHSLAKNGYAAMVIDPIQIAETFALHHGIYNQELYDWYARGYSPAGVEVWNAMRAIDYLETRPEIDAGRIGITGRSGGAAMSWFTASVDTRVKVAIPVMGISTYAANLKANTQRHHCDCMFVVNSYLHDMLHQGALIVPRPLLMAHGIRDQLFPVPGYEEFERRVAELYDSYGQREAFGNVVVDTGHEDSDFLREKAIRWFDRFLMKVPERELDLAYTDLPGEQLAVFPDGPPADAQNYRVHETFIPAPQFERFGNVEQWKGHGARLLTELREHVFRAFPKDAVPLNTRVKPRARGDYFQAVSFTSEPGVEINALLNRPRDAEGKLPALLYVASDGDDAVSLASQFRSMRPGEAALHLVVYPRGIGEIGWNKSFWKDTFRNAMHIGQTVDSLRLWDVLRAIALLKSRKDVDPARITVAGKGVSGAIALYAALLDTSVEQALLIAPPSSHVEGPIFLNVLRHLDLPEAAALLAPRRLSFYGRMPEAYEPVRHVYSLYGIENQPFVTMEINNVIQRRYNHNFASGL